MTAGFASASGSPSVARIAAVRDRRASPFASRYAPQPISSAYTTAK